MIYTAIDNFYVTEEALRDSPSRADGISQEVENQLRIYGCEIIQEGGILLKLPQAVMATGQVLLQRFFCKESLLRYNIKRVAWACCWLATKLEEAPRRVRDVLSVFVRVDRRRDGQEDLLPLDIYGREYSQRRDELIKVERHMLRTFGFILHVDHPHKAMLNYLSLLKTNQAMKQTAWNLANDSLRTTLCVRFKAEVLACGLIFLASRRLKFPMPNNPPWWEMFDVERKDVYTVAREVNALYSMSKVNYISVYRQHNESQGGPQTDTPKQQVPPSANVTPQASGSDSEDGSGQRAKGSSGVIEVSGTPGDRPLSTDAREVSERDEDQRSGQRSGHAKPRSERSEEETHSRRRHRRQAGRHSPSEDERRRSRSRSRSRDSRDDDRSRERRRREARAVRFGTDQDRDNLDYRERDRRHRSYRGHDGYRDRDRDRDYRRR